MKLLKRLAIMRAALADALYNLDEVLVAFEPVSAYSRKSIRKVWRRNKADLAILQRDLDKELDEGLVEYTKLLPYQHAIVLAAVRLLQDARPVRSDLDAILTDCGKHPQPHRSEIESIGNMLACSNVYLTGPCGADDEEETAAADDFDPLEALEKLIHIAQGYKDHWEAADRSYWNEVLTKCADLRRK